MDDYGLVSSNPAWTWIVEKQCFVSWTDKEEGPTCLGELSPRNQTSKLTINIGRRSNELLMALHLPISSRDSKHARDLFMVIPCNLDTSNVDMTFAPIQTDGRADLENSGFANCNLFHIPITLAAPCTVVMPQAKRKKPLKGTPKVLMSKLKSLSQTCSFDVYFRFDTFAQLELRKIFALVTEHELEIPVLLLDSMYNGSGGGVNLWLNQGLDLGSEDRECRSQSGLRQGCLPPPYTSHTSPAHVDVQVPFSDASVSSLPVPKNSEDEGVPESPFWVRMRQILNYRSPGLYTHDEKVSGKRAASADPLPDTHRIKRIGHCRTPLGSPTREAHNPSPNLELDDALVEAHHDAPPSVDRSEEIAHWLYSAWTLVPSAHHELRAQLLTLGAAAHDANKFATARIEASTKLAFAAAQAPKQKSNKPLMKNSSDAEEQVRELVQWVYGVRSDADIALLQDLAGLAGAAMDVVDCVGLEKEEKMERFLVCKARCIACACVLGGAVTPA